MSAWRATVGALFAVVALTAPLVAPGVASAAVGTTCSDVDDRGYTMCLYPESDPARPGSQVGVLASGFEKCDYPTITFRGQPRGTARGQAGRVGGDFDVPSDTATGRHEVEVVCGNGAEFASRWLQVTAPSTPTIKLDPASAAPGATLRVTGAGFGDCIPPGTHDAIPHPEVRISLDGTQAVPTSLDDNQGFSAHLSVASGAAAGPHRVTAECGSSPYVASAGADLQVVITPTGTGGGGDPSSGGIGPRTSGTSTSGVDPPNVDTSGHSSSSGGTTGVGTTGADPIYPIPDGPDPPARGPSGGGNEVLGALLALGLAALAVPTLRKLRSPKPASPPQATPTTVDAVLVSCHASSPQLRETGADRSVGLRVVAHSGPSTQTVRWREESR